MKEMTGMLSYLSECFPSLVSHSPPPSLSMSSHCSIHECVCVSKLGREKERSGMAFGPEDVDPSKNHATISYSLMNSCKMPPSRFLS